jgi:hypothetical protein
MQLKVLGKYQVFNSLLELCIVFIARIRTGWRWLDVFHLAGGFLSFGCMDLAGYGWNWLELFEHIGNDKQ